MDLLPGQLLFSLVGFPQTRQVANLFMGRYIVPESVAHVQAEAFIAAFIAAAVF